MPYKQVLTVVATENQVEKLFKPEVNVQKNTPIFDDDFSQKLECLFRWRRDVRRFKNTPVATSDIDKLLNMASLAPSVGNAQPWRFVMVETPEMRQKIRDNFNHANAEALTGFDGEQAKTYASLKLEGLTTAPVQMAIFTETNPKEGHGLGRMTMPETLQYSTVSAIFTMWLTARTMGLGVGWVSILNPDLITKQLDVPNSWAFTAYLCIGTPQEEHEDPELVRHGWQDRTHLDGKIFKR